jgi:hypothetical protein
VAVLGQIFRYMRGQKDMPSIATIQHPLGDVDPSSSKVCLVVDIGYAVNRAAVNPHPQLNMRMISQSSVNLERASRRVFRAAKEKERHSVSRRHTTEFAACFRCPEAFGVSNDLIEFLQQLNLLIDEQFCIPNHVDEQKMCDLELQIGRRFRGRVWRVHPYEPNNTFAVVDSKWESFYSRKTRGEGTQGSRRDSWDNFLGPQAGSLAL